MKQTAMSMRILSRHIIALSRISLLVIFFASSGFTIVLHTCSMGAASCCAHECCGDDCDQPATQNATGSVQPAVSCHMSSVIGGLTTDPAVVEKQSKMDVSNNSIAIPVAVQTDRYDIDNVLTSTAFRSYEYASPPAVEKYVLSASFLI